MSKIMSEEQSKAVQSRIMKETWRIFRENGIPWKDANSQAAAQVATEYGFPDASSLRRAAVSNLLPTGKAKAAGYKARYVALIAQHDVLPPDAVLNAAWGCGDGTLSSLRSELKKAGYEFARIDEGMFRVTKRPAPVPVPVVVEPQVQPAPVAVELVPGEQLEMQLSLNDQLRAAQLQQARENLVFLHNQANGGESKAVLVDIRDAIQAERGVLEAIHMTLRNQTVLLARMAELWK